MRLINNYRGATSGLIFAAWLVLYGLWQYFIQMQQE